MTSNQCALCLNYKDYVVKKNIKFDICFKSETYTVIYM